MANGVTVRAVVRVRGGDHGGSNYAAGTRAMEGEDRIGDAT